MAKGFSLDFHQFLDYSRVISEKLGEQALLEATKKAIEVSAEQTNINIGKAMKDSPFSFQKGQGDSTGRARESLIKVSNMPVEVDGTVVTAFAGIDLSEAPEAIILSKIGSPHHAPDTNLRNAIKVKGKYRRQILTLQEQIFFEELVKTAKGGESLSDLLKG